MYASTRGSCVPNLQSLSRVSAMGFQYGGLFRADATAKDPPPGRLNPLPSAPSLCSHFGSRPRASARRTIAAHRKDHMKIHEYQARKIFRDHGLPVPPERVAETPEDAEAAARELGGPVVIKAQVHVGGRGKAGGVKLARDPAGARVAASAILGMDIKGLEVGKVLVAPAVDIEHEAYVGIIVRSEERRVGKEARSSSVPLES